MFRRLKVSSNRKKFVTFHRRKHLTNFSKNIISEEKKYRYNAGQKLLRKTRKTASYLKPQAIGNSFKRAYGEVEDNIIIYIERLKT